MQIKNYYLGFNVKLFLVSIIYELFVNFVASKEEVLNNEHSRRHAFILLLTHQVVLGKILKNIIETRMFRHF